MDAWAVTYAGAASFVCVSCAGPQLATEFGKQLKLKACTNTWVDEEDMPTWGQLGCNGFIVLDGARSVVCRQSPAFLEVREQAFQYVDTLLSSLVEQNQPLAITLGTVVRITGLVSKPELNGLTGVCAGGGGNGRINVSLQGGKSISVKATNLTPVDDSLDCGQCDGKEEFDRETGGCRTAKRLDTKRSREELASRGPLQVASVKNAALDGEHERCVAALERLAHEQSEEAARAVLHEYEVHFAHEEKLLDSHLYAAVLQQEAEGVGGAGFSADGGARRSHYNDHQRLLSDVRALLGKGSVVSPDAIAAVLEDFERHADAYDGSYAERLQASLAAAAS
mmetsp:Transcript_40597/g.67415  ORF Transcript_40597/g.67415 Transcript_40597/m.67415 type:complete len:338 (+) Transcript_40597:204-1217(+)